MKKFQAGIVAFCTALDWLFIEIWGMVHYAALPDTKHEETRGWIKLAATLHSFNQPQQQSLSQQLYASHQIHLSYLQTGDLCHAKHNSNLPFVAIGMHCPKQCICAPCEKGSESHLDPNASTSEVWQRTS